MEAISGRNQVALSAIESLKSRASVRQQATEQVLTEHQNKLNRSSEMFASVQRTTTHAVVHRLDIRV